MSVEYRELRAGERRQRSYAGRLGFGDNTSDAEIDRVLALPTQVEPHDTLVVIDDGEIAAQLTALPLTMRWNNRDIGCGGVTMVSTLPTHRRRGHLRELMVRSFQRMRDGGRPVAMLWASMAAIYQRFGYGVAYIQHIADFDPRLLRFVNDMPVPGRVRMVKAAEARPVMSAVYQPFAAPRTLMLHRDEFVWERHILGRWQADAAPWLVAVYEETGEALGYAIYEIDARRVDTFGPDQQLRVKELAWLTPVAHRALVRHLAGYDLAYSVRIERMPVDDPLFYHAQEPRMLGTQVEDGTFVRIVDLPRALEGRGYEADGCLRFAFADDVCPWNNGTWELTVEGGAARATPTGAAPDLCLTPRTLAMLACGSLSAVTLARIGLIPKAEAKALRVADDLFRMDYAPLCADQF